MLVLLVCRGEPDRALSLSKASPHARLRVVSLTVHRSKGLTEQALARLGYADTIVFRPGYLRGAERPEKRAIESLVGYVARLVFVLEVADVAPCLASCRALLRISVHTSKSMYVLSLFAFTPLTTPQVPLLAKSMAKAGALGSSHIPADVGATKVDAGQDAWFTVLSNKAAALLGAK